MSPIYNATIPDTESRYCQVAQVNLHSNSHGYKFTIEALYWKFAASTLYCDIASHIIFLLLLLGVYGCGMHILGVEGSV